MVINKFYKKWYFWVAMLTLAIYNSVQYTVKTPGVWIGLFIGSFISVMFIFLVISGFQYVGNYIKKK